MGEKRAKLNVVSGRKCFAKKLRKRQSSFEKCRNDRGRMEIWICDRLIDAARGKQGIGIYQRFRDLRQLTSLL
jgi:hypothetical protein